MAAVPDQPLRMAMWVQIARGGSSSGGAAAGATSLGAMRAKLWRNLPDDIMWRVLTMVPAAKRLHFHLVSREWRRVLTSADFRKAAAARERGAAASAVACVYRGTGALKVLARSTGRAVMFDSGGGAGDGTGTRSVVCVDMDLSFVPRQFWESSSSDPLYYHMVAAGDGLVCVADGRREGDHVLGVSQLCVFNPATRTCKLVPKPPVWEWKTALTVRLHAGALTVLAVGRSPRSSVWNWAVAWYDLEAADGAGGRWTVAHRPEFQQPPARLRLRCRLNDPPNRRHNLVTCGGEWYCYRDGKVYVHEVTGEGSGAGGGAAGLLVVAGEVATPRPCDACAEAYCDASVSLVAHEGRVFFTALVNVPPGQHVAASEETKSCHIWVLDRQRMEWHEAGEPLHRPGLNSLRGFKYATYPVMALSGAYECGDLVCLDIRFVQKAAHGFVRRVRVTLGLNLVTRAWELVHDGGGLITGDDSLVLTQAFKFEFRPNLFLT